MRRRDFWYVAFLSVAVVGVIYTVHLLMGQGLPSFR
jgi:hypothetical protein